MGALLGPRDFAQVVRAPRALGVGLRAELDGDAGTLTLLEDAVEDAS